MNFKHIIFEVMHAFEDNHALIMLAVCCAAAAFFIGLIFLPGYFRRLKRRWRGKKRSAQA
jgi:hypothetical protein